MEYLRVQLKVCEGCGGLWYRTQSESVYGRCCAGEVAPNIRRQSREQRRGREASRHPMAMKQPGVMETRNKNSPGNAHVQQRTQSEEEPRRRRQRQRHL